MTTHCALAASNILVKKRCSCADIFTCACPESDKCLLKLADFDSVKPFQPRVLARHCQEWKPYVPMSEEECGKVMGTPGYRAPEVCGAVLLTCIILLCQFAIMGCVIVMS